MSGAEYCVYCDKHVAAIPANRVGPDFSASAVRPPMHAHPTCFLRRNVSQGSPRGSR